MAKLAPFPVFRAFTTSGTLAGLSGGKLYAYEAGGSTPKDTYTDSTGGTANANPVVLDSTGTANVWLGEGSYKFVLKDSADATIWTVDNIQGLDEELKVDSIAELKALEAGSSDYVFVGGYTAQSDGGQGWFYWDSTSSTSDNGGTIIEANSAPATGRWLRLYDGAINVKWFGAKGDASTNDADAFTNWIAALPQYGNGFIPSGHYIFDTDNWSSANYLEIPNHNITIEGEGKGSVLLEHTGTGLKGFFYGLNKNHFTLSDISLKGNEQSDSFSYKSTAFWMEYTDATVTTNDGNVTIKNIAMDGMEGPYHCGVDNQRTTTANPVYNIKYEGIDGIGGDDRAEAVIGVAARSLGCHSVSGGLIDSIIVSDCYIDAYSIKSGISFQGLMYNIEVTNCTVRRAGQLDGAANPDTGRYGIMAYNDVRNIQISNCTIDAAYDVGIYLLDLLEYGVSNCTIIDCPGTADTTLVKGGIGVAASTGTISNNTFINNGFHIQVAPGTKIIDTIISNCYFEDGNVKLRAPLKTTGQDNYSGSLRNCEFRDSDIAFFDDSGQDNYLYDYVISDNKFIATSTTTLGAFVNASTYDGIRDLDIKDNTFIKKSGATMNSAIRGAGGVSFGAGLKIRNNNFVGDWDLYCIRLNQDTGVLIADNIFRDHAGTGYIMFTDGCQGQIRGNQFFNCDLTTVVYDGTNSLGFDRPTFSGDQHGAVVQNFSLSPAGFFTYDLNTDSWAEGGMGFSLYDSTSGASGGNKEILIDLTDNGLEFNFPYHFSLKQEVSSGYYDLFTGLFHMYQHNTGGATVQKKFDLTELFKTTNNYFVTNFDVNIDVKSVTAGYGTVTSGKSLVWDQTVNGVPTEMKIIISTALGGQTFDQTEIWCTQFNPIESR